MKVRITKLELEERARQCGLSIHYECGGCRIWKDHGGQHREAIYPSTGICAVVPKREAYVFLRGWSKALNIR